MSNRMKNAPLLYGGAHILPAAIWSILIPTQHMSYIRRNYIQFHRIAGWLIVISAISLSISGSLFPLFNLSYSDPNLFHVHYLFDPTSSLTILLETNLRTLSYFQSSTQATTISPTLPTLQGDPIDQSREEHFQTQVLDDTSYYCWLSNLTPKGRSSHSIRYRLDHRWFVDRPSRKISFCFRFP